jgi:hypothetical protein
MTLLELVRDIGEYLRPESDTAATTEAEAVQALSLILQVCEKALGGEYGS